MDDEKYPDRRRPVDALTVRPAPNRQIAIKALAPADQRSINPKYLRHYSQR